LSNAYLDIKFNRKVLILLSVQMTDFFLNPPKCKIPLSGIKGVVIGVEGEW